MLVKSTVHLMDILLSKGGFTIDTFNYTTIERGYAVGIKHIGTYLLKDFKKRDIKAYRELCDLSELDILHLGAWIDGDYIHFYDTYIDYRWHRANELAKRYNQKYIYSLHDKKTLEVLHD